ncbi:18602_t:CDS:2, partial [Dentiscutata erythropus]
RNKWLYLDDNNYDAQLKKLHSPGYPLIEKVMERWLQYAFAQQLTLTDEILAEKAKRFATDLGDQNFHDEFEFNNNIFDEDSELNNQIHDIDEMIFKLPLNNLLSADEYLHLDDILPIEDFPDNKIIIVQVQNEEENEDVQSDSNNDNSSIEQPQIFSLQEGSNFARNLVNFLLQQDDDFGVSVENLEKIF